jgi:transposase
MNVRYRVTLSEEERLALQEMLGKGRSRVREVKRAQILLAADQGASEDAIAKAVHTSAATIYRTKRCFVEQGLVAALHEAHRPGGRRKLSGKEEALLIATACSTPPAGRARWTLDLLVDTMIIRSAARPSVAGLPRMISSHGSTRCGACRKSIASMSRGWRMCWTCMPSRLIPGGRWSVSMRAQCN